MPCAWIFPAGCTGQKASHQGCVGLKLKISNGEVLNSLKLQLWLAAYCIGRRGVLPFGLGKLKVTEIVGFVERVVAISDSDTLTVLDAGNHEHKVSRCDK